MKWALLFTTGLEKTDLKFRQAALAAWEEWKTKSPEAAALIEIHKAYMKANGIM